MVIHPFPEWAHAERAARAAERAAERAVLAAVEYKAKRNSGLPAEEAFAILQTFGMRCPGDVSGVTGGILDRMVTRRQVIYSHKRAKGSTLYGVYFLPGPVHRLGWALLDALDAALTAFSGFWDALSGVTARPRRFLLAVTASPRERWAALPRHPRRALGVLAVSAIVLAPIGISILITGMEPPGTSVTATGSVDQASVARPDCADWNTREFFEEATADDVARCLSQGADPRAWARDKGGAIAPDGLTPLHLAAKHSDSPEVVKVLVDAGADPNQRGFSRGFLGSHGYEMGPRPLDLTYSLEMAKALVDAGAYDSRGPYSRVKVLELVDSPDYCGDWNAGNVIYESGADRLAALNRIYQTEEKARMMHLVEMFLIKSKLVDEEEVSMTELGIVDFDIDRFQDEVLQMRAMDVFFEKATAEDMGRCISQGYDPNARAKNGNTPLHRASIPMTTALLDAGADPNTRNKQGETPLHLTDTPEAVKALVDAGADLEARTKDGLTPLHVAIGSYMHKGRNIETDIFLRRPPSSTTQQTPQSPAQPQVVPTEEEEWVLDPVKVKMRLDEISAVVKALLDAGADPTAKIEGRFLPVDFIDQFTPSDSPLRSTDVYWRLNEARYR
ncbi:MAG: hypothetical protein F4X84_06965 [Synechococcus sp. SB0662_bin_45]|nr:hypothetical protein [Synechococcus sp. SB0668_bin_13]MYE22074.1 hypothetical protein [Synechococcus sp. SB0662_bin_45]